MPAYARARSGDQGSPATSVLLLTVCGHYLPRVDRNGHTQLHAEPCQAIRFCVSAESAAMGRLENLSCAGGMSVIRVIRPCIVGMHVLPLRLALFAVLLDEVDRWTLYFESTVSKKLTSLHVTLRETACRDTPCLIQP